jgi:NAD(P)-dependent dehydrogenase (short-subunit alcohol dehydrogenase family)
MKGTRGAKGSVLITGAFSGIGKASALRLRAAGYRVFAGMYDETQKTEFEKEQGGLADLFPVVIDITSAESIAAALALVSDQTGDEGLAGLVNNAGIALAGPVEFLPLDTIRRQFEVNVIGHIAVTQAFTPLLRKAGGRIVNMGSVSSRVSTIFLSPYAMSKHALKAFNDSLRLELRPWGIKVILLEPGNVSTSIWETAFKEVDRFVVGMPPAGQELYGGMIRTMMATMARKSGNRMTADHIAGKVMKVLGAPNPRPYYPIGKDRRLKVALDRLLPASLHDRYIYHYLGLGEKAPGASPGKTGRDPSRRA